MQQTEYWVWLTTLPNMTSTKITVLFEYFDTIEDIYKAKDFSRIPSLPRKEEQLLSGKDLAKAKEIIQKTNESGAKILTYDDPLYPDQLRNITDPPYVLYIKGEILPWDRLLGIGVVGTRKCSDYGSLVTHRLCSQLAKAGVTVISGMARGLDGVAAKAALRAGAKTIAVLGCGIDIVYPPEHDALMEQIQQHGCVMTEYPPGTPPLGSNFPQRNRIISGLSKGVLVTEAPKKSGALITARYALDNGRDVFAVPGSILDWHYEGTNRLIQQGAVLVMDAGDILAEYPRDIRHLRPVWSKTPEEEDMVDTTAYEGLEEDEKKIASALLRENLHIDEISRRTEISVPELNGKLILLEMKNITGRLPGGYYKLNR